MKRVSVTDCRRFPGNMTGLPHHIQVRQPFYLNSSGLQDEHVPVVKFIVRSPGNFPVIAVRVRKIAMEAAVLRISLASPALSDEKPPSTFWRVRISSRRAVRKSSNRCGLTKPAAVKLSPHKAAFSSHKDKSTVVLGSFST